MRRPLTVGRGPVPRHASIERETVLAGVRFSRRSCDRGGNPLGCACGIRGPPRYDEKTVLEPSRGTGPRATVDEGLSLAKPEGMTSSPEVSPTGTSKPEVSPTGVHRDMKHPQINT